MSVSRITEYQNAVSNASEAEEGAKSNSPAKRISASNSNLQAAVSAGDIVEREETTSPRIGIDNFDNNQTSASKRISFLFTKSKKNPKNLSDKSLPLINGSGKVNSASKSIPSITGSTNSFQQSVNNDYNTSSSKSSIQKKLYKSNGSLGALIDIVTTQDKIEEEGGVSMKVFVEKYEETWVKSIIKAGECTAQTDIAKLKDGIAPGVIVASDSMENIKKFQMQKAGLGGEGPSDADPVSSTGKWAWGSQKALVEKIPSNKSLNKTIHPKQSKLKETTQNTTSPENFVGREEVEIKNPEEEKSLSVPKLNEVIKEDVILFEAWRETGDNILPLTVDATKLVVNGFSVGRSTSNNPISRFSSYRRSVSEKASSLTPSEYEDSEPPKVKKVVSLVDKIKSAFYRKGIKKSKISGKKDPFKLPDNFKLVSILKPVKGADTYVDQNLLQQINSSPNCYKYSRVMPTEINYDSKRVVFSNNAIDIAEAIRVIEKGEVPGVGNGAVATIPVNFIPNSQRIKQD